MKPIQTTFWEITEFGDVFSYENEGKIVLAHNVPKDGWFEKYGGSSWSPLYKCATDFRILTWSDLPLGATFLTDYGNMAGGECLVVMCPNGKGERGSWYVDSRASNCTKPDDKTHHCWIRHGDPKECKITVDKNGDTCGAGAGSIIMGGWHGFLRNGLLVEA